MDNKMGEKQRESQIHSPTSTKPSKSSIPANNGKTANETVKPEEEERRRESRDSDEMHDGKAYSSYSEEEEEGEGGEEHSNSTDEGRKRPPSSPVSASVSARAAPHLGERTTSQGSETGKFQEALIKMLEQCPNLVSWEQSTGQLTILDPKKLQEEVLPRFFRTTRYESFLRQLHIYSFRKVDGKGRWNKAVYNHAQLQNKPIEAIANLRPRIRMGKLNGKSRSETQRTEAQQPAANGTVPAANAMTALAANAYQPLVHQLQQQAWGSYAMPTQPSATDAATSLALMKSHHGLAGGSAAAAAAAYAVPYNGYGALVGRGGNPLDMQQQVNANTMMASPYYYAHIAALSRDQRGDPNAVAPSAGAVAPTTPSSAAMASMPNGTASQAQVPVENGATQQQQQASAPETQDYRAVNGEVWAGTTTADMASLQQQYQNQSAWATYGAQMGADTGGVASHYMMPYSYGYPQAYQMPGGASAFPQQAYSYPFMPQQGAVDGTSVSAMQTQPQQAAVDASAVGMQADAASLMQSNQMGYYYVQAPSMPYAYNMLAMAPTSAE